MSADSTGMRAETDLASTHTARKTALPHLRARAHPQRRRLHALGTWAVAAMIAGFVVLAGAFIAFILWPRWPEEVTTDAPSLPIAIGGVYFNVPPKAIRVAVQRHPGTQDRIDLAFLWPSLEPPDPTHTPVPTADVPAVDRIFVTIARDDGTLPPLERLQTIYPHYADSDPVDGPAGLIAFTFRADSPYKGETVFYDSAQPPSFIARCSRDVSDAPGTCLYERRIEGADITVRFPRDWIGQWQGVAAQLDRLIAKLHKA